MKQLTIRNVCDNGIERAREIAKDRDISLNAVLVEALEIGLGVRGHLPLNGLEKLAGDSVFGSEWDEYLSKDLNQIDGEIWR